VNQGAVLASGMVNGRVLLKIVANFVIPFVTSSTGALLAIRLDANATGQIPWMTRRPSVVLFDVVETLFSLAPVEDALAPLGVSIDLYFARLLRDGFALAAAGSYRAFSEVASSALASLAPNGSIEQRAAVQQAFRQLPPHPDAEPALAKLGGAGVKVCALTNGGADATETLLDNSGLRRYIDQVLTVDAPQRWKPSAESYRFAIEAIGIEPSEAALVAVHSWDIHGARRAGLTTGWCSRLEGSYPAIFDTPDVVGHDLSEVADALLSLSGGASPSD